MSLRVRVIAALFAGKLRLFPLESSSDPVLPLNLDSDAVLIRISLNLRDKHLPCSLQL